MCNEDIVSKTLSKTKDIYAQGIPKYTELSFESHVSILKIVLKSFCKDFSFNLQGTAKEICT